MVTNCTNIFLRLININLYITQGYDANCATAAVNQENTLRKSAELLQYEIILKKGVTTEAEGVFIWKPPVTVSIGKYSNLNVKFIDKV